MKTDTRHNSSPTTTIVSKLIYSTLFWLAHSLFTCLSLTLLFITRIGQICRTFGLWQGPSLVNHLISSTTNSSLLSSDFRLPTHIAVGVSEDEIDLSDIVNLICFCHYANIQFLSIYDQKGYILANKPSLETLLSCKSKSANNNGKLTNEEKTINSPNGTNGTTHSYPNGTTMPNANVFSQQFLCFNGLKIRLLNSRDGRQSLVEAARSLATQETQITLRDITKYLRNNYNFPDPELLIQFGKTFSVFGFPPWQIRLSEILHVGTLRQFEYDHFCRLLQRYAKCEQRFGK